MFAILVLAVSLFRPEHQVHAWKRHHPSDKRNSNIIYGERRSNRDQQKHNHKKEPRLPSPLQHHTRGGFTPPSARTPLKPQSHLSTRLSSSSTAPHERYLVQQQQEHQKHSGTKWNRNHRSPPLYPVDFDSQENDIIDGDLLLPVQERGNETPLSHVEELKRQVAMTSLEVAEEETPDQKQQQATKGLSRLDIALFGTYFCHSIAVTLPVILMPLVAAEHVDLVAASAVSGSAPLSAAAFVATVASISTLGGGLGKCLNGFVCQSIGGRKSSAMYLMGVAVTAILLGTCPPAYAGYILAWQEFFASIQWTACSLVLANHYGQSPAKLSKGITILSLASTSGTLLAKTIGTALLKTSSWRTLALMASGIAVLGASTALLFVKEQPSVHHKSNSGRNFMASMLVQKSKERKQSIPQSIKAVLSRPMFWQVGIAHATAMLARTSDRILGAFFHHATSLPRSICGGLTAFVTLGFVHGLCKGRAFHKLPNVQSKTKMLSNAYTVAALSAVGMALCANEWIQSIFFPSQNVLAGVIALLTGLLASNISFQFYQIPAMVATTFFDKNKALCLSLFDGMGFFLAAPVWAIIGKIIGNGKHGWTLSWSMLALMFAAGGKTMMDVFPATLYEQERQKQNQ